MEGLWFVVAGVIVVAVVTAFGRRHNVAGPIILVAIGLLCSLLPFIPDLPRVDPEWILVGVLPPLLYSSAVALPAIEFRRDIRPIAGLSVLLVVLSSVALGVVFTWVIPGLSLPLGIALGAILSPTDAVATSVVKRLGIAPRVTTILAGESLLNDATALVILRTAIAAIAGGFSLGEAMISFVWAVLGAVIVGVIVGWVNLRVRARIGSSAANTAIGFVVPFVAYLPAEAVGASGLVAAVVTGIITSQGAAKWFTPEQRMSDELNWRTIELVLEGGVFLVMGLELSDVVNRNFEEYEGLWHGAWLALSALGIMLGLRAAYVAFLLWRMRSRARRYARLDLSTYSAKLKGIADGTIPEEHRGQADQLRRDEERVRRRFAGLSADADYYASSPLGWKQGTIITWAGMRGVVTLAAAQTLPTTGIDHRSLLIFVAFLVAVFSLFGQGFTLASVVRALRIPPASDDDAASDEHLRLDAELGAAAATALADPTLTRADGTAFSEGMAANVGTRMTEPRDEVLTGRMREILELRIVIIEAMRDRLVEISTHGGYSTSTLRRALAELDADQISLELRLDDGDD
ncbi:MULTISPECIES: cation:proton antiporter [Microbacterium]|uniref:cation:proton antiporter n=1 Tax=Microbacterium TaxID=33882 RepID=UPI0010F988B2|nr:sodium:proton antiporter [Microbacterium sp. 4NA327F11]MCK9916490.1 sodium:proton antiporter [Microbacteriaceae bacterium K1510]